MNETEAEEAAIDEYRARSMSLHEKSELELKERLAKRRDPLRQPTYGKERRKKDKATERKLAMIHQKEKQVPTLPDDKTVQAHFGTAFTEALLETPQAKKKPSRSQIQFRIKPVLCKSCDEWKNCAGDNLKECEDRAAREADEGKALAEEDEEKENEEALAAEEAEPKREWETE